VAVRLFKPLTNKEDLHMKDNAKNLMPKHYKAIQILQQEFDQYQKAGFPERGANFFSLELCGEAGELANLEKKIWKGKDIPQDRFEDEAADVLIALMNYSNARGVNLADAVQKKMQIIEEKRSTTGH
jgi:NTP pyrophosphatase (non-canonical NTP hydrolase)